MSSQSWWIIGTTVFIVWYLSHQAGRLDRLHHRIEVTRSSLDTHFAQRSAICNEICSTNSLDPVSSALLLQATHEAIYGGGIETSARQSSESELSEVLVDIIDGPEFMADAATDAVLADQLKQLELVWGRIALAYQFHNDAVRDCLLIRHQVIVRVFRLAGRAALPVAIELDVAPPKAFAN